MSSEMLIKTIRPENRPWAKEKKKRKELSSGISVVERRGGRKKNSVKKEQSLV